MGLPLTTHHTKTIFNPILRQADRPKSRSKNQPTLFDVWDQTQCCVFDGCQNQEDFESNEVDKEPYHMRTLDIKVFVEEPVGDDDCYLGL
jgi:hypothetical protein